MSRGVGLDREQAAEQDPLVPDLEQGVLAMQVVRPGAHQLVDGAVAFHPLDRGDVLGFVVGVAAAVDGEVVGRVDLQVPLPGPPPEVQPGRVMPAVLDLGLVVRAVVQGEERAALAALVPVPDLAAAHDFSRVVLPVWERAFARPHGLGCGQQRGVGFAFPVDGGDQGRQDWQALAGALVHSCLAAGRFLVVPDLSSRIGHGTAHGPHREGSLAAHWARSR